MKHGIVFVAVFVLIAQLSFGQSNWTKIENPGWEYAGLLSTANDTIEVNGAFGSAVDGEGKIWTSTLWVGIVVCDMNGNYANFGPIDSVIIADTTYSTTRTTGAAALPDGDIIVVNDNLVMKFDYQTGEMVDYTEIDIMEGYGVGPSVDANGYIYVPGVIGVSPVIVLDSNLNFVQEIELDGTPSVTRGIAVTEDGHAIYVGEGARKGMVRIYSTTDLINYSLTDSIFTNTSGDTIFFNQPLYVNRGPRSSMWVSNDNYYGGGGVEAIQENSILNFNPETREYYEVMMPDTGLVHRDNWYYNGPRGGVFSDDGTVMYVASSNMGFIYKYVNTTIEPIDPSILVQVDSPTAAPGDTLQVPVHVSFPDSQYYSASQITIRWDDENLTFLGLDTNNTLPSYADWSVATNVSDSQLVHWGAGSDVIGGAGVLARLSFSVIGDSNVFAPITLDSVVFNTGTDSVEIFNGGVNIQPPPIPPTYGDVDSNNVVDVEDARHLLAHLFDDESSLNFEVADVSADGEITSMDASLILQYVHNVIDTLPYPHTPGDYPASGEFSLANDTIIPGTDFTVPVSLWDAGNIYAFEGTFVYTGGLMSLTEEAFSWATGVDSFVTVVREEYGKTRVAGAHYNAFGTDGLLGTLHFHMHESFSDTATPIIIDNWRWNEDTVQTDVASAQLFPTTVGMLEERSIPDQYILSQNYPNPFNPTTTIRYGLPEAAHVTLTVYDLRGRKIAILADTEKNPGWFTATWDGTDYTGAKVSTGVYFYRLETSSYQTIQKMVYLK